MSCRYNKRGQENASQAAVLVLIILLGIIVYVLLVPGPVREDLLSGNETTTTENTGTTSSSDYRVLLDESPGTLESVKERDIEHDIPSFNLFKTTDSTELMKVNPFYISSNIFGKKTKRIDFQLADPSLTNNVMLSFSASNPKGILIITLNNNVIFESSVQNYNVDPVELDPSLLGKDNYLEFSVSGVGLEFWNQNEYSIENLKLTGDVTDVSRRQSVNNFMVTKTENDNAESLYIEFTPECDPNSVGNLYVDLNSENVFSGVPDCGIPNRHEIDPKVLQEGENSITFRTDKGSYLVDLVKLDTTLKANPSPIYYFSLSDDDYKKIARKYYTANLTLEFVDDNTIKEGTVTVDGKDTGIYTQDRIWTKVINPYLQADQNSIKLTPQDTLDIVSLKLTLQR